MRLVVVDGQTVGLNTMWLPTWIGHNTRLIKELEAELSPLVVGKELTEHTLDEVNGLVIQYLVRRFQVPGLFKYLDAMKFLEL